MSCSIFFLSGWEICFMMHCVLNTSNLGNWLLQTLGLDKGSGCSVPQTIPDLPHPALALQHPPTKPFQSLSEQQETLAMRQGSWGISDRSWLNSHSRGKASLGVFSPCISFWCGRQGDGSGWDPCRYGRRPVGGDVSRNKARRLQPQQPRWTHQAPAC